MKRTILLVEDNPDDVELTVTVIREHGIDAQIDVVEDGVEALAYLEHKVPDLMLLDLNLPRVGGLEVLRRIRADARTRHIPIVVLTSSIEEQDVATSYASGANSYVRKPVDYDEFVEVARKLGEYWLAINQPPPVTQAS
jgi:two-component system response regulator